MTSNPSIPDSPSPRAVPWRVAWITPDYPPDRGGVSDHSSTMVTVLRAAGHEVLVCSRPHERSFDRLDGELSDYRPDLIVVAYTPLGYAPRTGGIAPALTWWSIRLRRRLRCRAILLAHEASLPAADLWRNRELKLAALGAAQVAQFSILAASFDSVLFSNAGTQRAWAQRISRLANRFHTIRICSNIPYHPSADARAELTAAGYSVPPHTILFFGTGHQSVLFGYVEAAFLALQKIEPNAGLVIVGMSPEKLRQLQPSLADLGASVQALGYVAAPEVSLWLQIARLVLAPLVEGVSARKGTVAAALQHGRAVVTTRGVHTCDDIAWDEICFLAPLDREAFAAKAAAAFGDPERGASVGHAARAEYDAHAAATVTASRILSYGTSRLDVEPTGTRSR
jgi:glycosyltransferase involved in cell wall biosynthesis